MRRVPSSRLVRGSAALLLVWAAWAVVAAGASAAAASKIEDWTRDTGQRGPLMRIGLEDGHAVRLRSDAPFRVVDPETGRDVWRPTYSGELRVVADGGPTGEVPLVYRVQVGAYATREAAEAERARLAASVGEPVVVHHDADRGNWRVRAGRATSRPDIQPLIERLRSLGLSGLWIAEEPAESLDGVVLRLVDESYESRSTGSRRLVVLPRGSTTIDVEGTEYRGIVELRVTEFGTVRPINWIALEPYLRGVVPREMGPEVWPRLEALKAQAVAARTYAWRNRGQFENDGYDICATPRCQVYGGASAEHPLSDRAVAATAGEVLVWNGEPIIAYYTATCGGHTEDGHEIFPEDRELPYLTGVPCSAENDALASLRGTLKGRPVTLRVDETGHDVTRDWTLLEASGVVTGSGGATDPIDGNRLREWTARLAKRAGIATPDGPAASVSTLAEAATAVVTDLGWRERTRVLLSEEDLPALLRDPATDRLDEGARRALAYLASAEALRPHGDGRFHPEAPATLGRIAGMLSVIADGYDLFGLQQGVVSGVGRESVRIVRGKGEIRLDLSSGVALFSMSGGRATAVDRLEVWPGDRIRYRRDAAGRIDFLELQPPIKGASDDRSAAVYSWQVRRTRRELEASIARRVSVGRLTGVEVARRGVSGRVVELRVVGTEGSTTVSGFDVRRLLDLRESLVVLEEQRDAKGRLESVLFTGKGWGHGVGLCQVGAYGMAVRGASYREILAHYYQGTELRQVEASGRR